MKPFSFGFFLIFLGLGLCLFSGSLQALPKLKIKDCTEITPSETQNAPPSKGFTPRGSMAPSPMQGMITYQPEGIPSPESSSNIAPAKPKLRISKKSDRHQAGKKADKKLQKAGEIYLSNDDSMSLASAQRVIYAIQNFLPLYRNEIRPHEFLNYYHFQTDPVAENKIFSANFQMAPLVSAEAEPVSEGQSLAIAIQGKIVTLENRRPAVITFLLDRSGSMGEQGKIDFLKSGLETVKSQLKTGDVLNVVEFDHASCNALENFVVGRDDWKIYDKTVAQLTPAGSTDLHLGLTEAYQLANKSYEATKLNRVILVTDAIANTGELSSDLMSSVTKYYDSKKIALSGIGVGLNFNDELLDSLTEAGKGAYLFLGIEEAIPRVFGSEFVSLLQTVARDVHFKIQLPEPLKLETFYGEEASANPDKVQAIHYFANSSQLFLLDLKGKLKDVEASKLEFVIDYENVESGQKTQENMTRFMTQFQQNGKNNIFKARLIMAFADLLEKTALSGERPLNDWAPRTSHKLLSFDRADGKKYCGESLKKIQSLEKSYSDAETSEVLELTKKYCSRF